jgi:hypothetical protein
MNKTFAALNETFRPAGKAGNKKFLIFALTCSFLAYRRIIVQKTAQVSLGED